MQRFWIQERAGQKLERKIQSQRLNETGCEQRSLLAVSGLDPLLLCD
jgi:hypothetical protein